MSEQLLQKIINKLSNIEAVQQSINEEMQSMKVEQQSMKDELQLMKTDQQQIKTAVMETNESVKRLEVIQESQQRIIELLSARSIQQEAELKKVQ